MNIEPMIDIIVENFYKISEKYNSTRLLTYTINDIFCIHDINYCLSITVDKPANILTLKINTRNNHNHVIFQLLYSNVLNINHDIYGIVSYIVNDDLFKKSLRDFFDRFQQFIRSQPPPTPASTPAAPATSSTGTPQGQQTAQAASSTGAPGAPVTPGQPVTGALVTTAPPVTPGQPGAPVTPGQPGQLTLPAPPGAPVTPGQLTLPAPPGAPVTPGQPVTGAPGSQAAQLTQFPEDIDEILKKFFSNISDYEEREEQEEDYYGFLYENLDNYQEVAKLFRYAFHLYLSNLIVELSNVNDSNKYLQTFKNMDVLNEHKNDSIKSFLNFDIQDIEKHFDITIKQEYKDEQMEEKKRKEKKQEDILKIITSYPAITDVNTYDGFLYNYVKKNKKEESVKKFKQILCLYISDLIYYNINYKSSNDYIFKRNEEINNYYKKIQKYTGNNIDMIISLFLDLTKDNLKVII